MLLGLSALPSELTSPTCALRSQHAHFVDTGDPELNGIMVRPYGCAVEGCDKRYRNLGGLKYHIEHAHLNSIA